MRSDTSILRGDILRTVYEVAGEGAKTAEASIKRCFYSYYDYKDITRAISYLEQTGYIVRIDQCNPLTGKKSSFFTITPEGMRAVEKITEDPGIVFEEESR